MNYLIDEQSDTLTYHFLDINEIGDDFEDSLVSNIINICGGRYTDYTLDYFKRRLNNYFYSKNDDGKKGAVAEFIIHLHLNRLSFTQECLFLNLEEGSIKKGFDGYYLFEDEHWLVESKSSAQPNIRHRTRINDAYVDLRNKLETRVANNPWSNAYNHMRHQDVNTTKSVVTIVRQYSEEFENDIFQNIDNFNIIPCSTLYMGDNWSPIYIEPLKASLLEWCNTLGYKKMIVICVNCKSYEDIINCIIR